MYTLNEEQVNPILKEKKSQATGDDTLAVLNKKLSDDNTELQTLQNNLAALQGNIATGEATMANLKDTNNPFTQNNRGAIIAQATTLSGLYQQANVIAKQISQLKTVTIPADQAAITAFQPIATQQTINETNLANAQNAPALAAAQAQEVATQAAAAASAAASSQKTYLIIGGIVITLVGTILLLRHHASK